MCVAVRTYGSIPRTTETETETEPETAMPRTMETGPETETEAETEPSSGNSRNNTDPFILHSLASGRVGALKEFNKCTYDRTEGCSVLLAIRMPHC